MDRLIRGEVSDYAFSAMVPQTDEPGNPPKYSDNGKGDPYAQIDRSAEIPSCDGSQCNFRDDGY